MGAHDSPFSDDDVRSVLHGVRLVGFGLVEPVARRAGRDEGVVADVLMWLQQRDFVAWHSGMSSGWSLTASGRELGESLLASELAAAGAAEEVLAAYGSFLELNQRFLTLCTAWQLKTLGPGQFVPNGHDDLEYDAEVIGRLGATDAAIAPVLERLAAALHRYAGYRVRLAEARSRIERGDGDWFVRPGIDSYHTVWFELHEDLLATLGRQRTSEH